MKANWKRIHKYLSLAASFFLVMACISGILLNHRDLIRDCDISRSLLPPFYRYNSWNNGLLRGTLKVSADRVAIYGNAGIWLADTAGTILSDFNLGLPSSAHYRNIRSMAVTPDSVIYALSTTGLYRRDNVTATWRQVEIEDSEGDIFSDLTTSGDSVIVMSRSRVYVLTENGTVSHATDILPPAGGVPPRTLFRHVWDFHSGQTFGRGGVILADVIAMVIVFLCVTGAVIWLLPKRIRRAGVPERRFLSRVMKISWRSHRAIGLYSLVFTILICLTGWCLRPPLLVALATTRAGEPATDSESPWHDRLRMIRHDHKHDRWLLSTSEGFYILDSLGAQPRRAETQPPVSVMGLNVWQEISDGNWLCGSFSGAWVWNTDSGTVTDYLTGEPAPTTAGPPFGRTAVAGFTSDLKGRDILVTYDSGTPELSMPDELARLPMSLWNVALEIHTGRIYFGNSATYFFIFVLGLLALGSLLSGYMLARHKKRLPPRNGNTAA